MHRLTHLIAAVVLCAVCAASAAEPPPSAPRSFTIAFWNLENLFDDKDGPGHYDAELMAWWNTRLYHEKLDHLAKVISLMNDGHGPDIMGFAEVENRQVVEDLVARLPRPEGYHIAHVEGPSERSIEVALITRFPISDIHSYFVWHYVRDILRVDLSIGNQPLTVLVNHWKSRWGGTLETSIQRYICASRAYQIYTDIVRQTPDADIVLIGDFNDTPHDTSVRNGLNATLDKGKVERQTKRYSLYNATAPLIGPDRGTHWYDHEWAFLDQMILSKGLLDKAGISYVDSSLSIFDPNGMLLRNDRPYRFGGRHERNRGYSDHLPLIASFAVHPGAAPVGDATPYLAASAWQQRSAERRALCYQAFQLATMRLHAALDQPRGNRPPAVVLDVDETAIDNTPYQVAAMLHGFSYPAHWAEWIEQGKPQPIPGSVDFVNDATARGVEVFFLTNRSEADRTGTLKNLTDAGFPRVPSDHLIMRTGSPLKGERRATLRKRYDLVLLIGDNLSDFDDLWATADTDVRNQQADQHAADFGKRFILLPNTIYGGWRDAIDGHRSLPSAASTRRLRDVLVPAELPGVPTGESEPR